MRAVFTAACALMATQMDGSVPIVSPSVGIVDRISLLRPMFQVSHLVPLLLVYTASAQGVTSPRGLDNVAGNASFPYWATETRFMQIDNTQRGAPFTVRSVAWRRDENRTQTSPPRSVQLSVDMGEADFRLLSDWLDYNYVVGSRVRAFSGTVNLPDWRAPLPGPTPFDFVVPLTRPFAYPGNLGLVIDLVASSATFERAYMDLDGQSMGVGFNGSVFGVGCVPAGRSTRFEFVGAGVANHAASPSIQFPMKLSLRAGGAPPAATSVQLMIDTIDRALSGVLCQTVHAFPTVTLTLPAAGGVERTIGFPFTPGLVGLPLYLQFLAIHPAQTPVPLVVSDAARVTFPVSTSLPGHDAAYGWASGSSNRASLAYGRGAVMRLGL